MHSGCLRKGLFRQREQHGQKVRGRTASKGSVEQQAQ